MISYYESIVLDLFRKQGVDFDLIEEIPIDESHIYFIIEEYCGFDLI